MPGGELRWRRVLPVAFALAIGFAAALPLLLRGPSCGQDFDFHLQSWLAVRTAWHGGRLFPHWVPWANYGAGEPRFMFYPPLSWLLGAVLGLAMPWAWVPSAFTGVCGAGAAWSMQRAAARLGAGSGQWTASLLYALSPYLLFCAFERAALAELLAAVWMPLLLAALCEERLPVARTALLLAALWYTNAPAAVMGCYLLLLALAWGSLRGSAREQGAARTWLRGLAALLLGSALAADYLLPAWYDERFVTIQRAIGPGMRIRDSFLFAHTGEPYHDQVLRTASWVAVATLLAGAFGAAALLVRRRQHQPVVQGGALLAVVLACCALAQFPFSAGVWHALPQLRFLQFPWRLMLPASAAAALLAGLALHGARSARARRISTALVALLGVALLVWAGRTRFQPCDDEDNVAAQLLLPTEHGGGFEGTDEYAAAGSDNGEIQRGLPRVRLLPARDADEGDDTTQANPEWTPEVGVSGRIDVFAWGPDQRGARVRPATAAFAVLRLERFPAWRVQLNGRPCGTACVQREDGLVTVAVPAGQVSVITATWTETGEVWAGRAISLAVLLALGGTWAVRRRRRFGFAAPL